eukprot:TRINITY_DN1785_c0_g1_i1.p1 TRINITY_DN1785_c0_g1~~TRINITY_DN1785_c0_g1_i1.p1  ORF type:complete len:1524 (+),score=346.26 TRINITY_DN1785_c0_g1_i1:54-4625(+)
MLNKTLWLILGVCLSSASAQFVECDSEVEVSFSMMPAGVTLRYQMGTDGGSEAIRLKLKAKNGSYAAVGFRASNVMTPPTTMKDLDILACDDKGMNVKDFNVMGANGQPMPEDPSQDAKFESSNVMASDYEVTFTRLLDTGDANDFTIPVGTFNIAFATGPGEVINTVSWSRHTSKDSTDITLTACPPATDSPTAVPTGVPTDVPTAVPGGPTTASPTAVPGSPVTAVPTMVPTAVPTGVPATIVPTGVPGGPTTSVPTMSPGVPPTMTPTGVPGVPPTLVPTMTPGVPPTAVPTMTPGVPPTAVPTAVPTMTPGVPPTLVPTMTPGVPPTAAPTGVPGVPATVAPTMTPGVPPTMTPTGVPGVPPTLVPTMTPGVPPTLVPTMTPGVPPTAAPTGVPGVPATVAPTMTPGVPPTTVPTMTPGVPPTLVPTAIPGSPPVTAAPPAVGFSACGTPQTVMTMVGGFSIDWVAGRDGGKDAVQFTISFKAAGMKPGFGAVGFRDSGMAMTNLDIIAFDSETDNVQDYNIVDMMASMEKPKTIDMSQDGTFGSRQNSMGSITIVFSRLLDTGDADDFVIVSGTPFQIAYATGEGEVFADTWATHNTDRGSTTITIDACPAVTDSPTMSPSSTMSPVSTPVPQTPSPPGTQTTPVPDTMAPTTTPGGTLAPTSVPVTNSPPSTPVPQTVAPQGSTATPVPNTLGPTFAPTNAPDTPVPNTPSPPGTLATPVPDTPTPVQIPSTAVPLTTPVPDTPSPAGQTSTPVPDTSVPTSMPTASPPAPPTGNIASFVGCYDPVDVPTSITGMTLKYTVGEVAKADVVMFEVTFPSPSGTVSFAAVGIGSNQIPSGMNGLDIYAFDSESFYVRDFEIQTGTNIPSIQDTRQDGYFLSKDSTSTQTTIKFYRKLDTGDVADYKIQTGVPFSLALATGDGGVFASPMWASHTPQNRERIDVTIDTTLPSTCKQFTACAKPTRISDPPFFVQYIVGKDQDGNDAVKFNIQVDATPQSWAAIGFSEKPCAGCMNDLDIYAFSTDSAGVRDLQLASGNMAPPADMQQDANGVTWEVDAGLAKVSFWRKANTGDSDDFVIPIGSTFNMVLATGTGAVGTTWQKHSSPPVVLVDPLFASCSVTDVPETAIPVDVPTFTRSPAALCDKVTMDEITVPGLDVTYSPGKEGTMQFTFQMQNLTFARLGFRDAGNYSDANGAVFIKVQEGTIEVGPSRKVIPNDTVSETYDSSGALVSTFSVQLSDIGAKTGFPLNVVAEVLDASGSSSQDFFTVLKPCYYDAAGQEAAFYEKCGKAENDASDPFSWRVGTDAINNPTTEFKVTLDSKVDYLLLKLGETSAMTNSDAYVIYFYNDIPVVHDCYVSGTGKLTADTAQSGSQDTTITKVDGLDITFQRLDDTKDSQDRDMKEVTYISYEKGTLAQLPVGLSYLGDVKKSYDPTTYNQTVMCASLTEAPTPVPQEDDDGGMVIIIIIVVVAVLLLILGIGGFLYCRSKEKGLVDYDDFVQSMGEQGINYQMDVTPQTQV